MNYAATIHLNLKGRDPLGQIDDASDQGLEQALLGGAFAGVQWLRSSPAKAYSGFIAGAAD